MVRPAGASCMKLFTQVHYWTKHELEELQTALDASRHGVLPVLYQNRWVRFCGSPTYTFHGNDLITVDGLDIQLVEPPL